MVEFRAASPQWGIIYRWKTRRRAAMRVTRKKHTVASVWRLIYRLTQNTGKRRARYAREGRGCGIPQREIEQKSMREWMRIMQLQRCVADVVKMLLKNCTRASPLPLTSALVIPTKRSRVSSFGPAHHPAPALPSTFRFRILPFLMLVTRDKAAE